MADHPAIQVLTRLRLPGGPEKDVQAAIASAFDGAGITYRREVHLIPGDIIDFMAGDVGIEVKIKGVSGFSCGNVHWPL